MIQSKQIEVGVREVRLEMCDLERILKAAGIINGGEAIDKAHIEPGELVITVAQ